MGGVLGNKQHLRTLKALCRNGFQHFTALAGTGTAGKDMQFHSVTSC